MCTGAEPALVVAAVGAAVGAGSAIMQGQQQKAFANYQAKQANADAAAEKGAAAVRADRIRKITRQAAARARADIAAGGVNLDSGTPLLIEQDILKRGEEDAIMGIYDASDSANRLNAQASGLRIQGAQAQTAGYLNAFSSALATGSNYGQGWKGASGGGGGAGTGNAVYDARGARAY